MQPLTIVFIGRSGSGKGTQVDMLKDLLAAREGAEQRPVFHLESGERFRAFIAGDSYSSKLSREVYETGALQPAFLSVWMWSHLMIDNLKGGEHLILDGVPRRVDEVMALDSAFDFYGRTNVHVIHLDIDRTEAERRLRERHRVDDVADSIKRRLDWFDTEVRPAIDAFRGMEGYAVHDIDGTRSIEDIHAAIVSAIGLSGADVSSNS